MKIKKQYNKYIDRGLDLVLRRAGRVS